jgi:hypothetical protein
MTVCRLVNLPRDAGGFRPLIGTPQIDSNHSRDEQDLPIVHSRCCVDRGVKSVHEIRHREIDMLRRGSA